MTEKWKRTTDIVVETRLLDMPDESLWRGDRLRLAHHPSLGPGSPPLDLMIYELWGYDDRLGLLILHGYKAGMPLFYFPPESQGQGKLSVETSWLIRSWNDWFCYGYTDEAGNAAVIPIENTLVIRQPQHMPDLIV